VHLVNLSGSYYEMGISYSRVLRLRRAGFTLPHFSEKSLKLAKECREIVEGFFPEVLDEIRGVAEASNLNYDTLSVMLLTHPQTQSAQNCSIFAAKQGDQVWLGRNYDMYYWLAEYVESYFTAPLGGYRSLGQTDFFVGREDGVNEKGLGVAMSGITSYFQPGVAFWIAIRYILDKCATVKEGVKFLTEAPPHSTITVLLADTTGNMAVVETSPMRTEVRWPEADFSVSTNHFNHPEMQSIKLSEPPDSRARYNAIAEALSSRSSLDESLLQRVLSDHRGLVCSHRDDIGLGTLWSTVTHLNTLRLWRAEGHPCTNPYREDNRLRDDIRRSAYEANAKE